MASSELVNMQNATAKTEIAKADKNTNNSEVSSDMFLKLMLEQLQYQDPLDPVSNTEFLSQQAMFTQLEQLMDLSTEVSSSNAVQQTLSLVGKEVTITDPDNSKKTITGVVESANFTTDEPTITINGKDYPLELVQNVKPNNGVQQVSSLVGKEVTITDPEDATKTITGVIDSVNYTKDGTTVKIGDKDYPLELVQNFKSESGSAEANSKSLQSIEKTLGDLNINFSGLSEVIKGFLSNENYSG